MKSQHAEFRSKVMLSGLTMQDVLEECAIRVAEGDSYMERLINDVLDKKNEGELQVAKAEIESIYDAIQSASKNKKDRDRD